MENGQVSSIEVEPKHLDCPLVVGCSKDHNGHLYLSQQSVGNSQLGFGHM